MTNSESNWLVIHDDNSILLKKDNTLPTELDIAPLTNYLSRRFALGNIKNKSYFSGEIAKDTRLPESLQALPLRKALTILQQEHYGMAVKAHSVIHWDKNHQFCGRCGSYTIHQSFSFERFCPTCKLSFFPRISPSIIVLIYRDSHLVMARSPHFLPGVYGLIAGFVEAGENLEDAVHREVDEEIGLKIKNLSYFGSQAWPFPDSLMVAYLAEYASGEIQIDKREIEDAGWYKYDNLPGRPSTSISIASFLIDHFIKACENK